MPIRLLPSLACYDALLNELGPQSVVNIECPSGKNLNIGLVNLMPTRIETERHWARLLAKSPHTITLQLIQMGSRPSTHTDISYLNQHYRAFGAFDLHALDAIILTGAPVELMPFEAVDYWEELSQMMLAATAAGIPVLSVCWGAQALLYLRYGIEKIALPEKCFGVFSHAVQGTKEVVHFPHSRYTGWSKAALEKESALDLWIESTDAGVFAVRDTRGDWYLSGHMEYEPETLIKEYERDLNKGQYIKSPVGTRCDASGNWHYDSLWQESAETLMKQWLDQIEKGGKSK